MIVLQSPGFFAKFDTEQKINWFYGMGVLK